MSHFALLLWGIVILNSGHVVNDSPDPLTRIWWFAADMSHFQIPSKYDIRPRWLLQSSPGFRGHRGGPGFCECLVYSSCCFLTGGLTHSLTDWLPWWMDKWLWSSAAATTGIWWAGTMPEMSNIIIIIMYELCRSTSNSPFNLDF